jgi:hypothetical protein
MNLAGVAELFFNGGGCGELQELPKARAGIRKTPGRQLDAEPIERFANKLGMVSGHAVSGTRPEYTNWAC